LSGHCLWRVDVSKRNAVGRPQGVFIPHVRPQDVSSPPVVRIAAGQVVIVCAPALQAFERALNLGQLIAVEAALARATTPITLPDHARHVARRTGCKTRPDLKRGVCGKPAAAIRLRSPLADRRVSSMLRTPPSASDSQRTWRWAERREHGVERGGHYSGTRPCASRREWAQAGSDASDPRSSRFIR
jgi:hypothetical protein